ncbi:M16 family metallopeptidase [Melioribacteraceae bacterium 4301-Me]|uniref:M16 family metallopeptidase n=1 Tax=Pyranulibacter aquaticus TaxID=3163344 RepID=UPI003596699D
MREKKFSTAFLFLLLFLSASNFLTAQKFDEIDIPYQKFVLKNGLTLIVHEDHKAPIVAVNVWYHVGSKNEKPGKTGFAHLFEHLMFNGSENYNDDYFKVMEKIGSTDLNGTTNNDRTNYFETVPTSALDLTLWMESDRMGHLIGAIDQAKLDEQRGVVQNEKRQGENEPYAISRELIANATYPKGHPYSWTVIGSMEDLNAASLEDVHEWFKNYYGAANAVICIAGDVNTEDVRNKVEKYFGDIPSGPPVAKFQTYIAKRTGTIRQVAQDRVPQARLYIEWNIPEWGSKELAHLDLLSDILSSGKNSRLYKRLVYDEQIATRVSAYYSPGEIGSQFFITADIKPGIETSRVEKEIIEELTKLLNYGPTEKELKKMKTQYFANFIRGLERVGGFGGKSDILAQNMVYGNSPDYYKTYNKFIAETTVDDIKKTGKKWLSDGVYILEIQPFPQYSTSATNVDRSKLPGTDTPPTAKFPELQKAELANGLKIILAERKSVPIVNLTLMIDAGYASDIFAIPGTASIAMNMLDEGTKTRDALQLSDELQALGATLNTGSNLDNSFINMTVLKANLDQSLNLFADVVLNPSFPQKEFDRIVKESIVAIQREKVQPFSMGLRVVPRLIYGKNHPYGNPFTGSGYESTISRLTRDDMVKFHQTWFKPNNATLIIVGDITLKEIKPKLEKLFANWKAGEFPQKEIKEVTMPQKEIIYIMDRPGSQSSIILGAQPAPPFADKDNVAIELMNDIIGGMFTSRINMNLREDKHWSYGSGSTIPSARGQRPYLFYGVVQTDKTKESIQEMIKEINQFVGEKPATEQEVNQVREQNALSLPGSWETNSRIVSSLINLVSYNLSDDYYSNYASKIKSITRDDIINTANRVIKPKNLIWVVIGDKSKIEAGIKELGYDVKYIDTDGNLIM